MALSMDQMARLDRLLDEALDLDTDQRRRWLQQLPDGEQDLLPALQQALLQDEMLGPKALAHTKRGPLSTQSFCAGQRVGPWELIRALGKGGMAEVWLARRADGAYEREVALKLPIAMQLRGDLGQRFAREKDILAALEHPHIARFYDAGVDQGLPYLVMEYVKGNSITSWCDARRLGIRDRMELFLQVLQAVQYAHEHGVLHRDIKPSNVLVTKDGQVRLLDFGVAGILVSHDLGLTQLYGRALTPQYASPEQLRNEELDSASDVYSLGVLLYELLTGGLPYKLQQGSVPTELPIPDRPSTQISAQSAEARALTSAKLIRVLKGDLDAIVLKSMAVDTRQRYRSAKAFAQDVKFYLEGKPIAALPGNALTNLAKAVRRESNKAVAASAIALLVLGLTYEGLRTRAPGAGTLEPSASPSPNALAGKSGTTLGAEPIGEKSIAVLAFVDMSEKHDQEYFSDGLTEELIDRLARSPDLKVIARTSSFYFKGKQATIGEIAKTLRVTNILQGSVRKSGQILRISVQLVKADDGTQLWSQTYEGNLADVFKLQDDIAGNVARALRTSVMVESGLQSAGINAEAHNLVLQGNFFRARRTREDAERAIALYERAIGLDSNYAAAWAQLATTYGTERHFGWRPARESALLERDALDRALRIDPNLVTAHSSLAYLHMSFDWDWSAAEAEVRRIREIEPNGDALLKNLASLESAFGRRDEPVQIMRKLVDRDPLNTVYLTILAEDVCGVTEHSEECVAQSRKLLQVCPQCGEAQELLGYGLMCLGRLEEALGAMQMETNESDRLVGLALVYSTLGRHAQARASLEELELKFAAVAAYRIATVHAYQGNIGKALDWLETAYQQRDPALVWNLKGDPRIQNLRGSPRYHTLLVKTGLEGSQPNSATNL